MVKVSGISTRARILLGIILLAGAGHGLFLLGSIPEGVFYSGDGGLKLLMAQQIDCGVISPNLELDAKL